VNYDVGFEPECCDEASGVGAIVYWQTNEGDPFCFDQLACSSGEYITISAGMHEQGTSVIEMVNQYPSKDSDAITGARSMI